ncbi:hypothetical protein [Acinetobacter sp. HY1485]|uniref:hypothetical protein n=1 Tax=Acinetobacter sp. HY1485 TaxID=2970918 RepID=UPI0022B9C633|nr:hypothetical protein [Acinetobacter sp. HY1485]
MPTKLVLQDNKGNYLVLKKLTENLGDEILNSFWVVDETSEFFPIDLANKLDNISIKDFVLYEEKIFTVVYVE